MSTLSHASRTGRRGGFASQSGSTRAESPSRPWRDAPDPQGGAYARSASVRSLPWGRDHCGSALATEGGEARHQLASPPSAAHLAASLGQRMAALTLPRCKIWIPLHGITLPSSRGRRAAPIGAPAGAIAEPLRGRSRQWPLKRHAAPESLLPSAGRDLRHSRAKAKGTPRPQRPRPFSRSSRDISRASAIASRMPRSVNPITRPVARFTAKPSAAPLTLRTRPSASER